LESQRVSNVSPKSALGMPAKCSDPHVSLKIQIVLHTVKVMATASTEKVQTVSSLHALFFPGIAESPDTLRSLVNSLTAIAAEAVVSSLALYHTANQHASLLPVF